MKNSLKRKKILITAGPTWVAIDDVRVITNVFTGETGCHIARSAHMMGARVTLLLGSTNPIPPYLNKKIEIVPFTYFDELENLIRKKLTSLHYDMMIHSAAVSDFKPIQRVKGKILSTKERLLIVCKPTPKIVNRIKKYNPSIFLVTFKLEINKNRQHLIDIGYSSLKNSKSDLVVANSIVLKRKHYKTLIIDPFKNVITVKKRNALPKTLLQIAARNLQGRT